MGFLQKKPVLRVAKFAGSPPRPREAFERLRSENIELVSPASAGLQNMDRTAVPTPILGTGAYRIYESLKTSRQHEQSEGSENVC